MVQTKKTIEIKTKKKLILFCKHKRHTMHKKENTQYYLFIYNNNNNNISQDTRKNVNTPIKQTKKKRNNS